MTHFQTNLHFSIGGNNITVAGESRVPLLRLKPRLAGRVSPRKNGEWRDCLDGSCPVDYDSWSYSRDSQGKIWGIWNFMMPVSAGQRQRRQKKWSVYKWQQRHAELDAIWFGGWTIIKKVRTANGEHRHSKCRHHIVNAMRFVPVQLVFRFEGIVLANSIITRLRWQDSSVGRAGGKIRLDFSENRW